jgi:hypothetical protein
MAVDLNKETCAFCGTRLTDRNPVVEDDGILYCCPNCFTHASQPSLAQIAPGHEYCGHCKLKILETETRIQRGASVYCCANCANAFDLIARPA